MKKLVLSALFLTLALALVACGGAATPAAPQATIKMETNPNPAVVGDIQLTFTITDQNGAPIEGAKINVSADHPAMSGMGMSGAATEQGGGKYAIKANFSDSGSWKITVHLVKGELDLKQELPLEIK
jgi:nitrogen fixation protein FixH